MSVEDLEKAIYACLAQADLTIEAMDAHKTVDQASAAKEAGMKAKADVADKAAGAKSEGAAMPAAPKQPADAPAGSGEYKGSSGCGVKRPPGDTSAPSSKRSRRKRLEFLGERDR